MGRTWNRLAAAREISRRSGYEVDGGVLRNSWEGAVVFLSEPPNYSEDELEQAVRVARMRGAGLSLQEIRKVINAGGGRTMGTERQVFKRNLDVPAGQDPNLLSTEDCARLCNESGATIRSLREENERLRIRAGETGDEKYDSVFRTARELRAGGSHLDAVKPSSIEHEVQARVDEIRERHMRLEGTPMPESDAFLQLFQADPGLGAKYRFLIRERRQKAAASSDDAVSYAEPSAVERELTSKVALIMAAEPLLTQAEAALKAQSDDPKLFERVTEARRERVVRHG